MLGRSSVNPSANCMHVTQYIGWKAMMRLEGYCQIGGLGWGAQDAPVAVLTSVAR
jgi:hypothetical protein